MDMRMDHAVDGHVRAVAAGPAGGPSHRPKPCVSPPLAPAAHVSEPFAFFIALRCDPLWYFPLVSPPPTLNPNDTPEATRSPVSARGPPTRDHAPTHTHARSVPAAVVGSHAPTASSTVRVVRRAMRALTPSGVRDQLTEELRHAPPARGWGPGTGRSRRYRAPRAGPAGASRGARRAGRAAAAARARRAARR